MMAITIIAAAKMAAMIIKSIDIAMGGFMEGCVEFCGVVGVVVVMHGYILSGLHFDMNLLQFASSLQHPL